MAAGVRLYPMLYCQDLDWALLAQWSVCMGWMGFLRSVLTRSGHSGTWHMGVCVSVLWLGFGFGAPMLVRGMPQHTSAERPPLALWRWCCICGMLCQLRARSRLALVLHIVHSASIAFIAPVPAQCQFRISLAMNNFICIGKTY